MLEIFLVSCIIYSEKVTEKLILPCHFLDFRLLLYSRIIHVMALIYRFSLIVLKKVIINGHLHQINTEQSLSAKTLRSGVAVILVQNRRRATVKEYWAKFSVRVRSRAECVRTCYDFATRSELNENNRSTERNR